MTNFERLEQYKTLYGYIAVIVYLFINNTINASSVWMVRNRDGQPNIAMWEPFAWEYSSALSLLVLLPAMFWLFEQVPPSFNKIKKQVLIHVAATVVFSLLHVVLMVLIRQWIYQLNGGDYDFGNWPRELWFEYRKDAWGYFFFFIIFNLVQTIFARIKGEAKAVAESEQQANQQDADNIPVHFLVKKLNREFLVKVSDIEWIESSGNYVNLHSKGRIYPLRATLANITQRLSAVGFCRLHRSHVANVNFIDNISCQPNGDGEVVLQSGKKLTLSRRYKDDFKQSLG